MKKIFLVLLLLGSTLFADVKNEYPSQQLLKSDIPIIDIRTAAEWRETGILPGSIPITFFNQYGQYNMKKFLDTLHAKVDTTKPFAIICRTGSRTSMLAPYLGEKLGYKVINLKGGIYYAIDVLKIQTQPYK